MSRGLRSARRFSTLTTGNRLVVLATVLCGVAVLGSQAPSQALARSRGLDAHPGGAPWVMLAAQGDSENPNWTDEEIKNRWEQ